MASEAAIAACYSVCGNIAWRCFAAAGATMGTLLPLQIRSDPRLLLCNKQFAECERACLKTKEVSDRLSLLGQCGRVIPYVAAACMVGYALYRFYNFYYSQDNHRQVGYERNTNSSITEDEDSKKSQKRPSKKE